LIKGKLNMSEAYLGEIRMFAGQEAPAAWAFCNGQVLYIVEYGALYSLIGIKYGGDGITTFALPDLRGRIPVHVGTGFALGQAGGLEMVSLQPSELPTHTHTVHGASVSGNASSPDKAVWAAPTPARYFLPTENNPLPALLPMSASAVGQPGEDVPHNNMMPFLGISFIICIAGEFPLRS
jgi:microcystin-dependent protein